jgi:HD-like signal output (HDOD) protein
MTDVFDLRAFWRRSITTAISARSVANGVAPRLADVAFIAGLLCDIGMVALCRCAPDDYRKVRDRAKEANQPITEIEHELLGITHPQVGRDLLSELGMPETVYEAVAAHHGNGLWKVKGVAGLVSKFVHSAVVIAELCHRDVPADHLDQARAACVEVCVVDPPNLLDDLLSRINEQVVELASVLSVDVRIDRGS